MSAQEPAGVFMLARKARAFGTCARAVAALEMALVTPFLLLMFLGSVELSRYFMIAKRVSNAAANMANLLATSKTDLTEAELLFISQARMLVPSIAEDTPQGFSYADKHPVALASIEFRPTVAGCQDGCTYEAFVTDSFMLAEGVGRACGKQTKIDDDAPSSFAGVPASLYGPGSAVVVDFRYSYTPLFGSRFVQAFTIHRAAFMAPRYASTVKFKRHIVNRLPVRWC